LAQVKVVLLENCAFSGMLHAGFIQYGAIARSSLTLNLVTLAAASFAVERTLSKSDFSCQDFEGCLCSNSALAPISPRNISVAQSFIQIGFARWNFTAAITKTYHGVVDKVSSEGCWARTGLLSTNFSQATRSPSGHSVVPRIPSTDRGTHVAIAKLLAVPVFALAVGIFSFGVGSMNTLGKLLVFFGAQTGMNLYMKLVLGSVVLYRQDDCNLQGIPAPFAVTGIQQLVSFTGLCSFIALTRLTPWQYKPKVLEMGDIPILLALSLSFTLNIALNNFSLSLIDVSTNHVIRSGTPLAILVVQVMVSRWIKLPSKPAKIKSVVLLGVSACFGLLSILAKQVNAREDRENGVSFQAELVGVVVCLCSLFSAGLELIIVAILGSSVRLNAIDVGLYMAIPSFVLLLAPAVFWPHTVSWVTAPAMTDMEVLREVVRLNPSMLWLVVLSGLIAMFYNMLLYFIIQTLSPLSTACASNFNKAAAVTFSLAFGLEHLPKDNAGVMMLVGLCGNLGTLTLFSIVDLQPGSEDRVLGK